MKQGVWAGRRLWRAPALCLALLLLVAALAGCGGKDASSVPSSSQSPSVGQDASGAQGGEGGQSDAAPPQDTRVPEGNSLYLPEFEPAAVAVCLVNENTGLTVYEKNADAPLATASLVKMMTCILAVEYCERYGLSLDDELVDSTNKAWVYDTLAEYRAATGSATSTADIRRGEVLSMRELLYAALLPSANEGALLLADHVSSGYIANFMYQMNVRAKALGCTGTWFADANGLSAENVTTARDMVLIVREFKSHPVLCEISAAATYEMAAHEKHDSPYTIHTTNRMLVKSSPYYSYYPGAAGTIQGGKTGSLEDWQNFASWAEKEGEEYICVVLNSPGYADELGATFEPPQARAALLESARLYDWVFTGYSLRSALDTTQPVTELRVRYSTERDTVRLLPTGDVKAVLPNGADEAMIRRNYNLPEFLPAPVEEGQVVGSVTLSVAGQEIGTSELVAGQTLQRNTVLFSFSRLGDAVGSLYIKVLLVLVMLFLAGYAGLLFLAHRSRVRQKQRAAAKPPPKGRPPQHRPKR